MNISRLTLVFTMLILVLLPYVANAGTPLNASAPESGGEINLSGCSPATSWDIVGAGYYWFNSSVNASYSGQGCINIRSSNVILSCTDKFGQGYNTITNIGNASASAAGINITQLPSDSTLSPFQNITIQNCTLAGWNGARGAGIFVGTFAWNVTFANVTFINNTVGLNITGTTATGSVNSSVGNLNITRNHFINNSNYHIWMNMSFDSVNYPVCGHCYFNLTNITVNNFTNGNSTNFVAAIFMANGSNSTIYKNNFTNLTNGVIGWNLTRFNITENNFSLINKTAVSLYSSANNFNGTNNISNNTIWGINVGATYWAGGAWGEAAGIRINSSNNTISFNVINVSNHSGINVTNGGNFTNITSNQIFNVTAVGIFLSDVVGGNVSGNNVTFAISIGGLLDNPTGYGIYLLGTNFTHVVYNFVNYSNQSIRVTSTNFTNITNNTLNNTLNNSAIYIDGTSSPSNYNITVSNNVVGNSSYSGSLIVQFGAIFASLVDGINITNNVIINTTGLHGIVVNYSLAANVSHNTLRQVNATWNNINISGVDNVTLTRNDVRESGQDGIVINGSNSPRAFYNTILSAGRDALALYNLTMGNFSENNLSTSSSGIRAGLLGSNDMQVNDSLFQNNNVTGNNVGLNLTQINHSWFENTRIWNNTAAQQRFGNANITHYNVSVNITNVSLQTSLAYYNVSYTHFVNVTVYEAQGALAQGATVDFLGNSLGSIRTATTNVDGNASLNLTIANQSGTDTTLSTTNFSAFNVTAGLPSMNASISSDMAVGQFDALKALSILMTFRNGANMTSCINNSLTLDNPGNYWFNSTGSGHVGSYAHHGGNCISIQSSNVVFSCTPNPIYDVGAGGISRLQYFQVGTRANASDTAAGINITVGGNRVLQNITIQNCTVTGFNGTQGAGILIAGHVWNLTISNVTFINNTVGLNVTGGNVTSVSPVGNLNVTRNHFTNNTNYHLVINISSAPSTSTYFNITNITVNNFTQGNVSTFIAAVFLVNGSNSTIYRNNFSNVTAGVIAWNLTRFNITENNFSLLNRTGVSLWASVASFNSSNNVSNNLVFNITGTTNVWGEVASISVNGSNNTVSFNLVNTSSSNGIVINGSNSPSVFYNTVLNATRDAFGIFAVTSANVSQNNFSLSGSGIHAGQEVGVVIYQVNDSLFQNNNFTGNTIGLNLTQINHSRFENNRVWNSTSADQRFGNTNITHYNVSLNVTNVSLQTSLTYYNVSYIHWVNASVRNAAGTLVSGASVDFLNILGQALISGTTDEAGNYSLNLTVMNQSGTTTTLSTTNFSAISAIVTYGSESGSLGLSDAAVGQFDAVKPFHIQTSAPAPSSGGGGGGGVVSKKVNQTKNQTLQSLNLSVELAGARLLAAKVTSNNSAPVNGVNLTLSRLAMDTGAPTLAAYSLSDEKGLSFLKLGNVGNYSLTATKEGYKDVTYQFAFKGKIKPLTTGLEVATAVQPGNILMVAVTSSNQPVEGATVRLIEPGTMRLIERATNSNGETTVALTETGNYAMNVTKAGFGSKSSNFAFRGGLRQIPAVLDISNVIRFPNAADVQITSDGKPVKGATVVFTDLFLQSPTYKTTDSQGYVAYNIPSYGRYSVSAEKSDFVSRNSTFLFNRAFRVTTQALRVVARGRNGLEVIITSTNGSSVVNATVTLAKVGIQEEVEEKQTDNDGIVVFSASDGNYSLVAQHANFTEKRVRLAFKNGIISLIQPSLDVSTEFGYPDRLTITAFSNGEPINGAIVDLSLLGSTKGSRVNTDNNGKAVLRLPERGNYTVFAAKLGYERGYISVSLSDEPSDLLSSIAVSLNLTNRTMAVEEFEGLQEQRVVTIAEITVTSNDSAVEGANVTFTDVENRESVVDQTDMDGKVAFEISGFGNYTVNVSAEGYESYLYSYSYGKRIELLPSSGLNVSTTLSYPSSARVYVTANSAPVSEATVTLTSLVPLTNAVSLTTDRSGVVLFPLSDFGNYTVTVRKAGLGVDVSNFTYYGAIEPLAPSTSISSFVYCPSTIEVTVVSDADSPQGAAVRLTSQSKQLSATLDADGKANFTLTELGNYSVNVEKPGMEAAGYSFEFNEESCPLQEGQEPLEIATTIFCPNTIQVNVTSNRTIVENALVRGYLLEVNENDSTMVYSTAKLGKLTGADGLANLTLRPPQPGAINFYTVNATALGHQLSDSIDFRYRGEEGTCIEKIGVRKAKRIGLLENLLPFEVPENLKPLAYFSILVIALLFVGLVLYGIRYIGKELKEWKK